MRKSIFNYIPTQLSVWVVIFDPKNSNKIFTQIIISEDRKFRIHNIFVTFDTDIWSKPSLINDQIHIFDLQFFIEMNYRIFVGKKVTKRAQSFTSLKLHLRQDITGNFHFAFSRYKIQHFIPKVVVSPYLK